MINVRRMNNDPIIVNAAHVLTVECTPDTLITLSSGQKLLVRESASEVSAKVTRYLHSLGSSALMPVVVPTHQAGKVF